MVHTRLGLRTIPLSDGLLLSNYHITSENIARTREVREVRLAEVRRVEEAIYILGCSARPADRSVHAAGSLLFLFSDYSWDCIEWCIE